MNREIPHPALFDTYNARFMEPRQIARSFVMPPQAFGLLCKNENSILIGPRGSGKTTLLKMLRPTTLKEWRHDSLKAVAAQIQFSSVYIGTDSAWTGRLSLFQPDTEEYRVLEILQSATMVTHALDAMLNAVTESVSLSKEENQGLEKFAILLSDEKESDLSSELAKLWRLNIEIYSIRALRFALHSRIQEIDDLYFRITSLEEIIKLRDLRDNPFVSLDIVNTIQSFVAVINEISRETNRVWAFCIDEIEILPADLQTRLLRSLRSVTDQRIRFKISASPFSRNTLPIGDHTIPMGGHDYTPITLTYAKKHEAVRFGRQILGALVTEFAPDVTPDELFGKSRFEPEMPLRARGSPSPYRPGGARFNELKALEREDPGFADYLKRRGIDLTRVSAQTEDERAEVRKLIQIAEIRREFGINNVVSVDGLDVKRHRSRKRVGDIYTGTEALLTLCEGNPRWLIGLIRPLLTENFSYRSVPRHKQASSVATAIARYLALLSTIPLSRPQGRSIPVTKAIDRIGAYFFDDITAPRFKTEPALSFIVDKKASVEQIDSIGAALNQGAFVFIPGQENEHCLGDIRNKRFRISYLLCPRYKLPLMYGQPVQLSRILSDRSMTPDGQYTLSDIIDEH